MNAAAPAPPAADRRFLLRLAGVSVAVLLVVGLWTRGTSRVARVEERLPRLVNLAERKQLPLAALVAACVAEAFRPEPVRADAEVAAELHALLQDGSGDPVVALTRFARDPDEGRRIVDLWRRHRARWERLAERHQGT